MAGSHWDEFCNGTDPRASGDALGPYNADGNHKRDPACSDPDCSYRAEIDRRSIEAEEQAAYWKSHAQDVERQLKTLILERKDLISKLERLKPRF